MTDMYTVKKLLLGEHKTDDLNKQEQTTMSDKWLGYENYIETELEKSNARIAELEAQNKRLVEAFGKACKLEHFKEHTYGGFEFSNCPQRECAEYRKLLAELTA